MKSPQLAATPIPVLFTSFNFLLVVIGTAIMAIGLYRMFPLMFNRSFILTNGPLALMLVVGLIILMSGHNTGAYLKWGKTTAIFAGKFLPLMILLCLVMAIGSIITSIHVKAIQDFLQNHRVIGPFVAALITPTSNALVPVVESAWKKPELQPMCLYYLQASVMMSVPLFMLRQFGFSANSAIPSKMYAMGIVVSITMLALMRPTFWLTELLCKYSSVAINMLPEPIRSWF